MYVYDLNIHFIKENKIQKQASKQTKKKVFLNIKNKQ